VKLSTINYRLSTVLVVGCVTLARGLAAEGNSSLSESKIENTESRDGGMTAAALVAQGEELRRQLSIQQESVQTLTTSLAESNAEAELFRRKYSELELRMEALGLESANKDRAKLEQRLLTAVSDLQLAHEDRDEFRDQMLRLNESMLRYLKTSQGGDAQARMDVETQLRKTNELVGRSIPPLRDAQEPQPGEESELRHLGPADRARPRSRGYRPSGHRGADAPAPRQAI